MLELWGMRSTLFCHRSQAYSGQEWSAVFVDHPTLRASMAQGIFYGGSGRWAVAHTRPAFAKNAYGPVGIPLNRGASCTGQWTQLPSKGGKSLGGRPPEAEGNLQVPRHTRPDPCRRQHGRPKRYPTPGEVQIEIDLRYLMHAPPYGHVWHKAFFLVGPGAGPSPTRARSLPKNALGPVGIPLVRGASGAGQWTQPSSKGGKSLGEGPLRPKEISRYRDTLGQIRAADNTAGRSATRHLERYQTEIDLSLWQRNLSVQITVRRVYYGEMGKAPTTISEDIHLKNCIQQKTDPNTFMVTFDVTNLYSNIPHELGKQTISFWIKKRYPETLPRRFNKKIITKQ